MEAESVSDVVANIRRRRDALSDLPPARTEQEAIDRITALEELTSAVAAAQAREALTLDMLRRNREAADGVLSKNQGRGVGAEVGLARKVSRARGSRLLGFARTLLLDLPCTYAALKRGAISEEKARVVATETAWLPREKRQQVDEQMADRLAEVGVGRLGNEVRALAQKLDQVAAVSHLDHCREERRITVRPAPGNMAYLTAFLPMPQAVAAYANLSKSAATQVGTGAATGRSQSQTMADLLIERVTGQASADAVPLEVLVVINDDTMFDAGDDPAWLPGFGPIPAGSARSLIADNEAAVFLRRMYTRPMDGQLVGMDSRRREFAGLLRQMVTVRDDVCRTPWCDAQIKHADHATSFAAGGATSWENSSGLCAACNFVKELSGWSHQANSESLTVITPTGHRYTTTTRALDGRAVRAPGGAQARAPGGSQARAPVGSQGRTSATALGGAEASQPGGAGAGPPGGAGGSQPGGAGASQPGGAGVGPPSGAGTSPPIGAGAGPAGGAGISPPDAAGSSPAGGAGAKQPGGAGASAPGDFGESAAAGERSPVLASITPVPIAESLRALPAYRSAGTRAPGGRRGRVAPSGSSAVGSSGPPEDSVIEWQLFTELTG